MTRPATVALIGINVMVFVFTHDMTLIGGASLRQDSLVQWATYGFPIAELGEWWRLATGAFLHADIRHLLLNMIMFFLLGRRLERQTGPTVFIAVCATSLIWGSAGALLAAPNTAVVGASGVVYGVMAAVLVVERLSGRDPWSEGLGTLIIVNVVLSFVIPGISVGGHLGGLCGGLLCGWTVGDQRRSRGLRMWIILSMLGLLGCLLGVTAANTWLEPLF
ncbi:MAG: rhomboid family intramembrane serine protease [Actinomycetota bacterium]|nr:rhomboid family intramembrane serine protease [Actinomycetota bacterium]